MIIVTWKGWRTIKDLAREGGHTTGGARVANATALAVLSDGARSRGRRRCDGGRAHGGSGGDSGGHSRSLEEGIYQQQAESMKETTYGSGGGSASASAVQRGSRDYVVGVSESLLGVEVDGHCAGKCRSAL